MCLYVCRARVVWRQNEVLPWLESNVNIVLDRIESKDPLVNEYKEKRSLRYSGTPPRPILRHVILSDYKEKVPLAVFVSKEKQAIMTYDPLPPPNSVNCYHRYVVRIGSKLVNSKNQYLQKIFVKQQPHNEHEQFCVNVLSIALAFV